mmetsp:Transcript_18918/g.48107  ORF Transcript_18918/g.48107 Transcript_18918/m.48107 type:complete len:267 (-) Transcript_18918:741-1541(-)
MQIERRRRSGSLIHSIVPIHSNKLVGLRRVLIDAKPRKTSGHKVKLAVTIKVCHSQTRRTLIGVQVQIPPSEGRCRRIGRTIQLDRLERTTHANQKVILIVAREITTHQIVPLGTLCGESVEAKRRLQQTEHRRTVSSRVVDLNHRRSQLIDTFPRSNGWHISGEPICRRITAALVQQTNIDTGHTRVRRVRFEGHTSAQKGEGGGKVGFIDGEREQAFLRTDQQLLHRRATLTMRRALVLVFEGFGQKVEERMYSVERWLQVERH